MSTEIPSSFSRFKMTDEEALTSSVFTVFQKHHIHNLRVEIAEAMLNIEDDIEQPLKHVKERARLQGQLDAYAGLINISESAETLLKQLQG